MIGMSMIDQHVLVLARMVPPVPMMILMLIVLLVLLLVIAMIIGMLIMIIPAKSPSPRLSKQGLLSPAASEILPASLPHCQDARIDRDLLGERRPLILFAGVLGEGSRECVRQCGRNLSLASLEARLDGAG